MLTVPGEFTNGRATHVREPQELNMNLPPAHCANCPCTHAVCPSVQEELAVRVANWALSFWASNLFCCWKFPAALEAGDFARVFAEESFSQSSSSFFARAVTVADSWNCLLKELSSGTSYELTVLAGADEDAGAAEGGLLLDTPTPGFWVTSTSWVPSATPPCVLAGHDLGGLTGEERPKGIVPLAPT